MSLTYNSYFFNEFYEKNGGGNYTNREQWEPFFYSIADNIIERFNPKTVLDAGCATGYLVEAFRARGVEAYGIDISDYAISNAKEEIRQYLEVQSILDPLPSYFPQKFDLVITLEVLEHLFPEEGKVALEKLCEYSDNIIFSSTPNDIDDRTHVNVQLGEYWVRLFAENSFFHELIQPLDFICPWAMHFVRKEAKDISNVIFDYELNIRIDQQERENQINTLSSSFYYDNGDGFSEENCLHLSSAINFQEFHQRINIPENTLAIRFDPVEDKVCILQDLKIVSDIGPVSVSSINGTFIDKLIIFDNFDPHVFIDLTKQKPRWIDIKVGIFAFEDVDSVYMLSRFKEIHQLNEELVKNDGELRELITQKEKENEAQKEIIAKLNNNTEELDMKIREHKESALKQQELIGKQQNEIGKLTSQIEKNDSEISQLQTKLQNLENEHNYLQTLFNSIIYSKFWRITKPIRSVLVLIKKKVSFKKVTKKEDLHSNIDCYDYKNNILTVNGWIFSERGKIDDLRLIIKIANKDNRVELASHLQRIDVEEAYSSKQARYSGFQSTTLIENCNRFEVYLEFNLDGEKRTQYVGKFRSPILSRLNFIRKKITKHNVRKAVSYLRHRRLDLIISALKRPRVSATTSSSVPMISLNKWMKEHIVDKINYPEELYNHTIDIVVPVFNGYEYFDSLFQSISHTSMKYRLIIINDKSSDERVYPYLQELAANDLRIMLLENRENVGFVQTVNKGLKEASNHIVLLNTDVELPDFWLERLMLPIIVEKGIASTTPFTNSGTLCSFPQIGIDNAIFGNLSCNEVDSAFQCILPSYKELPTGVGFCMGMNKDVVKEIGILDAETFSKGYGEENDWCQRAIKSGYKNVIVENLFVYHKHGGSFLSEEKKQLIERNGKILSKLHPNYNSDVAKFFERDPLKNIRDFIVMKLSSNSYGKKPILAIDHHIGGGANAYLDSLRMRQIGNGEKVIVVRYDIEKHYYHFNFYYGEFSISYRLLNFSDLEKVIQILGCREIYINELVTYPKLYETFEVIRNLKKISAARLIMLLHDYFSICPMTNLLNDKQSFCNLPELETCESCAKNNSFNNYWQYESIQRWRKEWKSVINSCDEIIAFSGSSAELLEKVYGKVENLKVVPHQVDYIPKLNNRRHSHIGLNIGLLGILNFHKGLEIVRQMLHLISSRKLNVRIILLGSSEGNLIDSNFVETGRYSPESLPRLAIENEIDLFFISSIVPETFSYTTEEAMKMGLPVAVFDLGAPAERVKEYEKGLIISKINADVALDEIIAFSTGFSKEKEITSSIKKVLFIAEYISFSSRYRVEHFQEQLLIQGVKSEFTEVKELDKYDIREFNSVVIYRCAYNKKLAEFIESAKKAGLMVYYDIDDYIFNYQAIKNLTFLQGDEYLGFEDYSNKILKCMTLSDGFFTSTKNMENAIKEVFPDKPVWVNRNVASMEMVSLSNIAKRSVNVKKGKGVSLGYFSGSKTHDGDFEIINNVLLRVMEKYENLNLMIGGCLNLNPEFNKFTNRVITFDFVDWRKLPELIASIDINLMPLEDTFFHACKSENKWMEAALVNVPTIASLNSELVLRIENGVTGFLCASDQDWEAALTSLIESKDLRDRIGRAANSKVLNDHVTLNTGKEAKEIVTEKSALVVSNY
ncbi:bifunctional 3-demethylubiquinone-9 3-methyltransferase/ 2-octaprenyl-6-hydroxy phenol methylase [compost metagenome]